MPSPTRSRTRCFRAPVILFGGPFATWRSEAEFLAADAWYRDLCAEEDALEERQLGTRAGARVATEVVVDVSAFGSASAEVLAHGLGLLLASLYSKRHSGGTS